MTRLVLAITGVFALVYGAALLLFVLPGAAVQHPSLRGWTYWSAVFSRAVGPGTVRYTLLGLGLVVAGIAMNLRVVFPSPAEVRLYRGIVGSAARGGKGMEALLAMLLPALKELLGEVQGVLAGAGRVRQRAGGPEPPGDDPAPSPRAALLADLERLLGEAEGALTSRN